MANTSMCLLFPAEDAVVARAVPRDRAGRDALFGSLSAWSMGSSLKSLIDWHFKDHVFDGKAGDWGVWVHLLMAAIPSGVPANRHARWLRGDAYLSVTVRGVLRDSGDVHTFELDFEHLGSQDDFVRLVQVYSQYRLASDYGAWQEAEFYGHELFKCAWIDPVAKLGLRPCQ